jgi:hypothetical protein
MPLAAVEVGLVLLVLTALLVRQTMLAAQEHQTQLLAQAQLLFMLAVVAVV